MWGHLNITLLPIDGDQAASKMTLKWNFNMACPDQGEWPSKIEYLVVAVDWLCALKPLVMRVKVGGSEQCVNISLKKVEKVKNWLETKKNENIATPSSTTFVNICGFQRILNFLTFSMRC